MAKSPLIDDPLLDECETRLGYRFRDRTLLLRALTHSSAKAQTGTSNERLEFLGDSILGLIVTEYLFHRLPHEDEGKLTRIKSVVVSSENLAETSRRLEMQRFLITGKGITQRRTIPRSILANVFEALIAAVYLDSQESDDEPASDELGFRFRVLDAARRLIMRHLRQDIEAVLRNEAPRNYKSLLQQYAQKHYLVTPTYRVVSEHGPDHGKTFEIIAELGERAFESGWGRSKKDAEQRAAEAALRVLLGDQLFSSASDDELLCAKSPLSPQEAPGPQPTS